VFAVEGRRFSGNPLCVFEDADGLSTEQMQAIARQFNLAETTFLLPPTVAAASARVRIFTPTGEMPFAGHPSLGSAHVVRSLRGGETLCLEMQAGLVEVTASGNRWTLETAYAPRSRTPLASPAELAEMLRLPTQAVLPPLWVDTGVEQLLIPLSHARHVAAAAPVVERLATLGLSEARSEARSESVAYVWATDDRAGIVARFFYVENGGLLEDPATGSACANLGGYLVITGHSLPVSHRVRQGAETGRPSQLELSVDRDRRVFVSGEVIDVGHGALTL
jgi:PhzF family phenazine biosynthesis protein